MGGLPEMPGLLTSCLERKMDKLDIRPIPEFIEMIADTGAGLYGCQASCDLFGLSADPRAIDALLAAYRAAAAIEKRVREEIGDEAMEQFFRVLDVVADGEPVQPEDRHVPPGPAQPLRVWLQEQEDGNPGAE